MIKYVAGDILKADCQALVNPVNCVGVMGKGLALQFKKKYPEMYKEYKEVCKRSLLHPGEIHVFYIGLLETPQFIINFATKDHWNSKSKLGFIENGLKSLCVEIEWYNIRSIALPALGCGEGGLKWVDLKWRIESWLGEFKVDGQEVEAFVYLPKELWNASA